MSFKDLKTDILCIYYLYNITQYYKLFTKLNEILIKKKKGVQYSLI